MRIQILPLPSVVVGDNVEEPFAIVVDQWEPDPSLSDATRTMRAMAWQQFREECGARALISTPETVEVVDRSAEPAAPQEPVPGNVEALRELHRLAEHVHDNFPEDAAQGGGTIVDVAIRLLGEVSHHRGVQKLTAGWPRLHPQAKATGQRPPDYLGPDGQEGWL